MSGEEKKVQAPACTCGDAVAGAFTAKHLAPDDPTSAMLVLHHAVPTECSQQRVKARWWEEFYVGVLQPAQREREMANQLLGAVVGQLPGKQIRIHAPTAFAQAAATGFHVTVKPEDGEFLDVRSPDASLIVLATSMPAAPPGRPS